MKMKLKLLIINKIWIKLFILKIKFKNKIIKIKFLLKKSIIKNYNYKILNNKINN